MKLCVLMYCLLLNLSLFAVDLPDFGKLKTQTQLVKKQLPKYILNIKARVKKTLNVLGVHASDYKFIEKEGERIYLDKFYFFDSFFAGNHHKMIPNEDHSLTFANDGSIRDVIKSDFGFCAGFSTVTRKLNLGLHFDPDFILINKNVIPKRSDKDAWIAYFSKKIKQVLKNSRFSLVPYYKNLADFIGDNQFPEFKKLVKEYIAAYWAYHNINTGGIKAMLNTQNKNVVSGLYTFHNKIARRLESGLNPIYYLSKPSDDLFNKDHWIHVLQAYDVSEIRNSSFTIKFWDINSNREYGMKKIVEVYFERDEKGIGRISANYNGSRLSGIFELNNDKQDITSFISNDANFDFCDKYKINGVSICYDSIDNYSK